MDRQGERRAAEAERRRLLLLQPDWPSVHPLVVRLVAAARYPRGAVGSVEAAREGRSCAAGGRYRRPVDRRERDHTRHLGSDRRRRHRRAPSPVGRSARTRPEPRRGARSRTGEVRRERSSATCGGETGSGLALRVEPRGEAEPARGPPARRRMVPQRGHARDASRAHCGRSDRPLGHARRLHEVGSGDGGRGEVRQRGAWLGSD